MLPNHAVIDYESLYLAAPRSTIQNVYCSDEFRIKLASKHRNPPDLTAIHSGLLHAAMLPRGMLADTKNTDIY